MCPAGLANVVAISAHSGHSLALLRNGSITAWGNKAYGLSNAGPWLTNAIAVAVGTMHSLALLGTSLPKKGASLYALPAVNNKFKLSIASHSGSVYALQYKDSLNGDNWTTLPLVAGNGIDLLFTNYLGSAQRFYRVLRW